MNNYGKENSFCRNNFYTYIIYKFCRKVKRLNPILRQKLNFYVILRSETVKGRGRKTIPDDEVFR